VEAVTDTYVVGHKSRRSVVRVKEAVKLGPMPSMTPIMSVIKVQIQRWRAIVATDALKAVLKGFPKPQRGFVKICPWVVAHEKFSAFAHRKSTKEAPILRTFELTASYVTFFTTSMPAQAGPSIYEAVCLKLLHAYGCPGHRTHNDAYSRWTTG
jgi:hypothetical protein